MQLKIDQKSSMEAWYTEEISHLKQQLSDGYDNLKEALEAEKVQEVTKLTRQVGDLVIVINYGRKELKQKKC